MFVYLKSVIVKCLKLLGKCQRGNSGAERGKTLQVHLQWHRLDGSQKPGRGLGVITSACGSAIASQPKHDGLSWSLPDSLYLQHTGVLLLGVGSPVSGGCSGRCSGAGAFGCWGKSSELWFHSTLCHWIWNYWAGHLSPCTAPSLVHSWSSELYKGRTSSWHNKECLFSLLKRVVVGRDLSL